MLGKLKIEQRGSLLGGSDPATIRWSDTIARVQAVSLGAKITAWSNEESPLLLGELMRKMQRIESHDPLVKTDLCCPQLCCARTRGVSAYLLPTTRPQAKPTYAVTLLHFWINTPVPT